MKPFAPLAYLAGYTSGNLTFLAQAGPTNDGRIHADFAGQDARFLVGLARKENAKQQASVAASRFHRANSLKVQFGLWN